MIELKDLVGKHKLDAVDYGNESIKQLYGDQYEDCQVCRFRLDGVVYAAIEDPNDGYRSSMRELIVDAEAEIKNVFSAIDVFCIYKDRNNYDKADILLIYDIETAEVVLEVGTDSVDDYYPCYVATFQPENMCTNADMLLTDE